jgi:hypothetical protein
MRRCPDGRCRGCTSGPGRRAHLDHTEGLALLKGELALATEFQRGDQGARQRGTPLQDCPGQRARRLGKAIQCCTRWQGREQNAHAPQRVRHAPDVGFP